MRHKRIALALLVTVLGAGLLWAGGKKEEGAAAEKAAPKQVLVGAFANGPGGNGGNPGYPYSSSAGYTMVAKMFTPLTILDEQGEDIVLLGASSLEPNADATVWTAKIHEDLKWSDGKDVTAEDVKFTVEFVTDPDFKAQQLGARNMVWADLDGFKDKTDGKIDALDSVRVIDEDTVQFTLAQPNPRFFANLYRSFILPKHAIDFKPSENMTTDWWLDPERQVGSGPFTVANFVKDEYLELDPNPHYFKGRPKLDKLICQYFGADITSAVLALQGGEIDFSYVNFSDLQTLPEDKFEIYGGNSTVVVFIDLNFDKIPDYWRDIRVRQAILYAIDRDEICEKVLKGTHSVLPGPWGFEKLYSDDLNWFEHDPEKARQLLAEAGVDPEDIEMNVISHSGYNNLAHSSALQAVQSYLADIGITFNYQFLDVPSFRSRYASGAGKWEFAYRGWGAPMFGADPAFLNSNEGRMGGEFSGYDYSDKGFPEVIEKIKTAPDMEAYEKGLTELNDLHNQYLPDLMMWVGDRFGAAGKKVKDFHWFPAAGGGPYADHAERWYIGE